MSEKRKQSRRNNRPPNSERQDERRRRSASGLCVRRVAEDNAWALVHPRSAIDRAEDLEEVRAMIGAGETEIAVDELRWLLDGCPSFIEAHRLLGELAQAAGDLKLARGHFGAGYELGRKATEGLAGPLPYRIPENQAFFACGKGLVACLVQLGKRDLARDVARTLARLDPSDPLNVGSLVENQ